MHGSYGKSYEKKNSPIPVISHLLSPLAAPAGSWVTGGRLVARRTSVMLTRVINSAPSYLWGFRFEQIHLYKYIHFYK